MKNFIALLMLYIIRFSLWFRYRVTVKGTEHLNPKTLNKKGGVLFLPNHPTAFVDPTLVTLAIWKKYPLRPMIVEYMYYTPGIHQIMLLLNALPVPNFVTSSNSFKKKKADHVIEQVIDGLKNGENFLVYPAGKTKHQAKEIIAASGVQRILEASPDVNVVLVRTTGLWGSRFSRALDGTIPPIFSTIFWGMKKALQSLLFFLPRRNVTLEFVPAPADFPYNGSRLEINRYLENWYNRPDGVKPQTEKEPGESLNLVSYSMWKTEIPEVKTVAQQEEAIQLSNIPVNIQEQIKKKLAEMTHLPASEITPSMNLAMDLGLDSLDTAELVAFLDDEYEVPGVPVNEMTTVGKVMALAAKQVNYGMEVDDTEIDLSIWNKPRPHELADLEPGATIPEVFLNLCAKMKKQALCADATAGVITYADAKLRVVLLAEYIRSLPGQYIGIMLPSSVAAYLTIIACQLAGKIPLMVNWTVGSKHLESVVSLSGVQVILSSWAFLDKVENVDLKGAEDLIVMLEDVRRGFSIKDKLKAFIRSKKSTEQLLALFGTNNKTSDDTAVLLFTSGTESMPKGVPLSHENVLSNERHAVKDVELFKDDVLLGILPPFHSFGFTVSGLLPLLSGMRAAYFPDPTDGKAIVHAIEKWSATILCGAPSFLRGVFKNGTKEQLLSLRFCVTGAEKTPQDLFEAMNQLDHCRLLEGYGITECSPILTVNLSGKSEEGVGKPLMGTTLSIVDLETLQPVRKGERGLVIARGPNIFKGYLNQGIASPFVTSGGQQWYSTGDLGYLNGNGSLILSGRLKRFVKIGGEMINLSSIEDALIAAYSARRDPSVEGPLLAVSAKEEAGEKTLIVLFSIISLAIDEVNQSLKQSGFSNLVKIFKIEQLEQIPLMGSGKTNYRELDEKAGLIVAEAKR